MKQKSNYLHKKFGSISQNMEIEDEIGFTYYDLGFGFNVVFGTEDIQTLIIFPDDYWQGCIATFTNHQNLNKSVPELGPTMKPTQNNHCSFP